MAVIAHQHVSGTVRYGFLATCIYMYKYTAVYLHSYYFCAFDMDTSTPCFSVALCEFDALPDSERLKAEQRYAKVLCRQLGGEAQVLETLHTVQSLEDAPPEDITEEAKAAYARWMKACRAATEAGMQGLGEAQPCWFEVRRAH